MGEDVGGLVVLRSAGGFYGFAGGGGERGGHSCGLFNLLRGCFMGVVRGAKNIFKYFPHIPNGYLEVPGF